MIVKYMWIWPGQPGGYEPKVADQMIKDRARLGNIKATPNHQPKAKPKPKPKPTANRSLNGLSRKADAAVARYRAAGARHAQKQK